MANAVSYTHLLIDEAWSKLGEIPAEDVEKIRSNAKFDVNRILEIEQETRHDVVAFTRCVSESLGEEKKWIHYGVTSTDVVDTANGIRFKNANKILREDIHTFMDILKTNALKYKDTVMMGRTHGVHAEITTFGLVSVSYTHLDVYKRQHLLSIRNFCVKEDLRCMIDLQS